MAARAELELSWVQIFNLRLIQLYCPFYLRRYSKFD